MHIDLDLPLGRSTAAQRLRSQGFCVLNPQALSQLAGQPLAGFDALSPYWNDLPPDIYLKDGGRYRSRRHSCYVQHVASGRLEAVPHRAHWQPTTYNALHGGMERWFEPVDPGLAAQPAWEALIHEIGALFTKVRAPSQGRWYIEAHPFRIDTSDGVGRPTPEGAHRDGVDFVAVVFVGRGGVKGGETRVFEADGSLGVRFTLTEPWTALLLDDLQVVHESTPILPADAVADPDAPADGAVDLAADPASRPVAPVAGRRDTLVLTYREGGFQAPAVPMPVLQEVV